MNLRFTGFAAGAALLLTSGAFAQTAFPEIEPNTNKAEATAAGTITMTAGDAITGTTTGAVVTALSTLVTSVDNFRVKTTALPAGIYQHRLTLTSAVVGHTGSLRGLNQTGTVGVGGTAGTVDTTVQTSITTSTPPRFNAWYGFGKQEEIYYRVTGAAATTAAYGAVLSTTPIAPSVIATPFEAGSPITISTQNQTTVDTELLLYDSTFTAIPGGVNDDAFGYPNTQSILTRTLPAGTYYLAVATFELCSNIPAPNDDDFVAGVMLDFPDCVALSSSALANDYDFQICAANGTVLQSNTLTTGDPFRVTWWQFTTALGAPVIVPPPGPANDTCATATAIAAAGGTVAGTLLSATNDGTASCDPGGASSRDVWYSWTNTTGFPRNLAASTCGTLGVNDTALSVYSACGGTELACNDNNGACTLQPLSSAVSGVSVANGATVLIRVSDKGLGTTCAANFTLAVTITAPPPPNDDCATPSVLSGLGTFPVSNAGATTGTQGQAEAICLFFGGTAVRQDIWYTWTATDTGPITLSTCGGFASGSTDTKIAVYNGAGCPTGPAIVCNDDAVPTCAVAGLATTLTFTPVCGNTYTIQFGMYQGTAATYTGNLFVTSTGSSCATPSTVFCDGNALGMCAACANNGAVGRGCANSSFAAGTELVTSGIASVGTDTLVLTTNDMPGPGLFFQSNTISTINPFGDGMLCASGGIIRMGVVFPTPTFNASYPGGLTPNPISVAGAPIAAGDTKHYQVWYRDSVAFCSAATFNTSNGRTLTWGP